VVVLLVEAVELPIVVFAEFVEAAAVVWETVGVLVSAAVFEGVAE